MAGPGLWCFPDADDIDGLWTPSTGTDLYAVLDIATWGTGNSDNIESDVKPSNDFCRVACAAISDPGEDDGHQLYTSHRTSNPSGVQIDLTVHCYNGTTEVGTGYQYTAIGTTSSQIWEIPSADVGGSPGFSYTDPRIGLTANSVGGGAGAAAIVPLAWYRIYGDTKVTYKSDFSDDFESNDEKIADTRTTNGSSAAIAVAAGGAISGSYGLDCAADNAGDNADYDYLNYWFGHEDPCIASDKIVVDFNFRWDSWTRGGYNTSTSKGPIQISNMTSRMFWLSVAGTRTLQFMYTNGDGIDTKITGTQQFTLDQDYEIRLILDRTGADPVISWEVDGAEIGSDTDDGSSGTGGVKVDSGNNKYHILKVGLVHINQWESTGYEWSIDDLFLWDDEYAFAAAAQVINMSAATLVSSPQGLNVSPGAINIPMSEATLVSSAETMESVTSIPPAQTVSMVVVTLVSSAQGLNNIIPGATSVPLSAITLVGALQTLTPITVEPQTIVMGYATLVSSAQGLNVAVDQIIPMGYASLVSSIQGLNVIPGAASVEMGYATLVSAAQALTPVGGAVTVPMSSITLASAIQSLIATAEGGPITIPMSAISLVSSIQGLTPIGGAVSVPMGYATLVSSAESLGVSLATYVRMGAVTLASSVQGLSVIPGATTVPMSAITLTGAPQSLSFIMGGISVPLSPATLVSSAQGISILIGALGARVIPMSAITLQGALQSSIIVPGGVTLPMGTVTLVSSAQSMNFVGEVILIAFILFGLNKRKASYAFSKKIAIYEFAKREADMDITYL